VEQGSEERKEVKSHEERIREAFFVPEKFLPSKKYLTATEVEARWAERDKIWMDAMGRMIQPVIDRAWEIIVYHDHFLFWERWNHYQRSL
jgi:hypothetical protein